MGPLETGQPRPTPQNSPDFPTPPLRKNLSEFFRDLFRSPHASPPPPITNHKATCYSDAPAPPEFTEKELQHYSEDPEQLKRYATLQEFCNRYDALESMLVQMFGGATGGVQEPTDPVALLFMEKKTRLQNLLDTHKLEVKKTLLCAPESQLRSPEAQGRWRQIVKRVPSLLTESQRIHDMYVRFGGVATKPSKPIPLYNPDNMCYMNSSLQLLRTLPQLQEQLAQRLEEEERSSGPPDTLQFLKGMQALFRAYDEQSIKHQDHSSESRSSPLTQAALKLRALLHSSRIHPEFEPGLERRQQDAAAYLEAIFTTLHWAPLKTELTYRISPDDPSPFKRESKELAILQVGFPPEAYETRRSYRLTDLLRQTFQRSGDTFYTIEEDTLPHLANDTLSVGDFAPIIERTELKNSPSHFFIQLKRFSAIQSGGQGRAVKLENAVEIPASIDLSEYGGVCYRVTGAIFHLGGYGSGHYIARVQQQKRWYYCSDTIISEMPTHPKFSDAYILLLSKKEH